jgi:hypothetical protein
MRFSYRDKCVYICECTILESDCSYLVAVISRRERESPRTAIECTVLEVLVVGDEMQ